MRKTTGHHASIELDGCLENRIEIIAERIDGEWEEKLMDCLYLNG